MVGIRFMHVGTRKIPDGASYDYFMGFRTIGKIRKAIWAIDDNGKRLNHVVVMDRINWDAEISPGWASHCDAKGNWLKGKKQAGEKSRRAHLEKIYDDLQAEAEKKAEVKKRSEEEAQAKALKPAEEERQERLDWLAGLDRGSEEGSAFAEANVANDDGLDERLLTAIAAARAFTPRMVTEEAEMGARERERIERETGREQEIQDAEARDALAQQELQMYLDLREDAWINFGEGQLDCDDDDNFD